MDAPQEPADPALRPEHPLMLAGSVVLGVAVAAAWVAWIVAEDRSAFRLVVFTGIVAPFVGRGVRAGRVLAGHAPPTLADRRREARSTAFAVGAVALLAGVLTALSD